MLRASTSLRALVLSRTLHNSNNNAGASSSSAGASSSSADANPNDGEGFNLNFETKADEAFFRAQENNNAKHIPGNDYNQRLPGVGEKGFSASLPSAAKYRAMSTDELIQLMKLRDKQIDDIRNIYENFHNEVEKQYRKQIFDYHDKALGFSQTHGQIQSHSINHTREALVRMREQEELEHRDLKICYTACLISTFIFWLWVRSHYIAKSDIDHASPTAAGEPAFTTRTQGFSFVALSKRLSGNNKETWYEKEVREEKEKLEKEQTEKKEAVSGSEASAVTNTSSTAATPAQLSPEDEAREAMRKERAWR